jgi:iron complex transport system permease protein
LSERARWFTPATLVALVVLLLAAMVIGPGGLSVGGVVEVLLARLSGREPVLDSLEPAVRRNASLMVWDLRLARALVVALIGAALGAGGTVTQGLFRNPMAEPGVLGVSMGAAAAAVLGFVLGLDGMGLWTIPLLAAGGATATLVVLFFLVGVRSATGTLLLSGIAVGALASATITLLLALNAHRWDLGIKVVHWLMGSFEARSWPHLWGALVPCVLGLGIAAWLRTDLDVLHLGDATAASLGVALPRSRTLAILCVALLVGSATAVAGVIGFLGLIVPHVARMIVGAGHRRLIPAATALGAASLVMVDDVLRSLPGFELPPGVITSFLGAPFFLWLLRKHRGDGLP